MAGDPQTRICFLNRGPSKCGRASLFPTQPLHRTRSENVPLSALRTGRLNTDRTCAVKVPKLIASIKVPRTHPLRSFSGQLIWTYSYARSLLMCTRGMDRAARCRTAAASYGRPQTAFASMYRATAWRPLSIEHMLQVAIDIDAATASAAIAGCSSARGSIEEVV